MIKHIWLKNWFILIIIYILLSLCFILYINKVNNVPLRFSNSISFDAKISFLKKSNRLDNTEIIIIGSSMGLNNINTRALSESLNNKNILNLSSWGLKVNEIYDFLQIIDLSKVKKIIYLNQYFDFYGESINSYPKNEIKDYLYENSSLNPYLNTFFSLRSNFKDYIYWKKRYLNKNKYSSLNYNEYGDVNLYLKDKYINKKRWEAVTEIKKMKNQYPSLSSMSNYLKNKKIDLLLVTTPYREKFFKENKFTNQYNQYLKKINELKNKDKFDYINTQNILNLKDEFFIDSSHLNSQGANLVSEIVSEYLNK